MTEKHLQAKRKHHHVWADYLKRWSANNRDVYYTTAKGNIVLESVRGVAMEKDFYQITHLKNDEIEIIKEFLKIFPQETQQSNMSLLKHFLVIQGLESLYFKNGKEIDEVEELFHAQKCNTLEDLHSSHEVAAIPIITALAKREFEILENNQNMIFFMSYFGHQISRTKNFRDSVFQGVSKNFIIAKSIKATMQDCWWFISYMFGNNIGQSLYLERNIATHSLLINDTGVPFITSDQPIINVHECLSDTIIEAPEFVDFYYPISPNIAYVICDSNRFSTGKTYVSEEEVIELNIKMAKSANVHIFANNKHSLSSVMQYVVTIWRG
jgi:hypothetical protein